MKKNMMWGKFGLNARSIKNRSLIFGGIIKSHGRVSVLAKLLMGVQIVIYPVGGCKEKSFLKVINMRWVGLAAQYMITDH